MVLIKENITEAATMLENLLMNCVENENIVNIHANINGSTIRYSSTIEEFSIEEDEFYIVCGWFELDIQKNITQINYNKEENSVHILYPGGEIYLDINEDDNDLE